MGNIISEMTMRRSIREYQERRVPMELLETLVKAGTYAPSARNRQKWHFTVIQNDEARRRITDTLKRAAHHESVPDFLAPLVDTPQYRVGYNAPALIVISGDASWGTAVNDCTLAAGNIMLAAHSLGLGSCWINQPSVVCDVPEFRALLTEFGVPPEYKVFATLCAGYPDRSIPHAPERLPGVVNYVE